MQKNLTLLSENSSLLAGATSHNPAESYFTESLGNVHHYYITGEIGHARDYHPLFELLGACPPQDQIMLHLNTPGGSLDTTLQLVNAMKNCPATITSVAEGFVASAGTIILHAAHQMAINDFTYFMYHDGAGGMIGKFNEMKRQVASATNVLHDLYHDVYKNCFTPDEIDAILNGEDVWLQAAELQTKIKERMEFLSNEEPEAKEESQEERVESDEGCVCYEDGAKECETCR